MKTTMMVVLGALLVACGGKATESAPSCDGTSCATGLIFDDEIKGASTVEHSCPQGETASSGACACDGCAIEGSRLNEHGGWSCLAAPEPGAAHAWVHLELACAPAR